LLFSAASPRILQRDYAGLRIAFFALRQVVMRAARVLELSLRIAIFALRQVVTTTMLVLTLRQRIAIFASHQVVTQVAQAGERRLEIFHGSLFCLIRRPPRESCDQLSTGSKIFTDRDIRFLPSRCASCTRNECRLENFRGSLICLMRKSPREPYAGASTAAKTSTDRYLLAARSRCASCAIRPLPILRNRNIHKFVRSPSRKRNYNQTLFSDRLTKTDPIA
jgi:hypothetical protein